MGDLLDDSPYKHVEPGDAVIVTQAIAFDRAVELDLLPPAKRDAVRIMDAEVWQKSAAKLASDANVQIVLDRK